MKNYFMIFNFIALACLMVMFTTLYVQLDTCVTEYDTDRLSKAIEYSGDMAFNYSLSSINSAMSYLDMKNIILSPNRCLPAFEEMLCLNYDMSICEDNLKYIEDSIATALLASSDGYYITLMSEVNQTGQEHSHTYEFNWSPKLPYSVATYNDSDQIASQIALYIGSERWIRVNTSTLEIKEGDSYADIGNIKIKPNGEEMPALSVALSKKLASRIINTRITNAISQNIDAISNLRSDVDYNIYIPSAQTSRGLNQISSPSFLVIMKDTDFSGKTKVRSAQISGLKVIKKIRLIGYLDSKGRKKYCYESQIADSNIVKINARKYFETVEDAAKAGYSTDFNYIFNKIDAQYIK